MAGLGCRLAFLILKYLLTNLQNNTDTLLPISMKNADLEISANDNPNYYFSPFSLRYVLAFAQSGARGPTAEELQGVVGLPRDQYLIEDTFRKLLARVKSNQFFIFNFPNKLYIKDDISVNPMYKMGSLVNFHSDVEAVPFGPSPHTAEVINKWVATQTSNNIQEVVNSTELDALHSLLISVLYFQGRWVCPFKTEDTFLDVFYQIDNTTAQVETMHKCDAARFFKYAENRELGAKFLKLPLYGAKAAMYVVLPNERYGVFELERQFDEVLLPQMYSYQHVNISLPKWTIKTRSDLTEILQKLKVTKAFNLHEANFRGITHQPMNIDAIIQQVYVGVHEHGLGSSEATAYAPAVVPKDPVYFKQFKADHPFIYYIKYDDVVVFAGRVGAPTSS